MSRRGVVACVAALAIMMLAPHFSPLANALPDVGVTGGNEPNTAVMNPLNPANVVVGRCSLFISMNFGRTFGAGVFPGIPPGYPFTGQGCDDALAFDSQGRLFWSYLLRGTGGDITVAVQQVNPTTGALIGAAVDVTPGTFGDDKPWLAADANPASPFRDNLYVVWTRFSGTTCPCTVMFSRSQNQGATWSAPAGVSAGGEGFVWPSHVTVAPNGDVYASYHTNTCGGAGGGTIQVLRDSSGGANLAAGVPVQKTAAFSAGQATITCNVQTAAGAIPQTVFWMQGAAAPYVLADPVRPGTIYVISNDDPNNDFNTGDPGDVVLARSTDNGLSWSVSTVSHGPLGTLQVFPNGAIDQDGNIAVFWYDTRLGQTNAAGNFLLDVYATVSRDGGLTFTDDFRINDAAFNPDLGAPCRFGCGGPGDPPPATLRIGEYNGIAAANGVAYGAFTGNSATGQQVFFDAFSILGAFPDRFEPNDALSVATDLGAAPVYNQAGLTIHTLTDEDFFKVVALNTGKLTFEIEMNGRVSDLDIQVQDKFGNAVANVPAGLDSRDSERLTIPAVQGEPYFLRVFAHPGQNSPFNTYSLTITNTAAPVPFELDLSPASDSGVSNSDDLTNVATPTIRLRLDDADFLAEGISFSATDDSNLSNDAQGFKVQVFRNGIPAGFATPVAGQPGVYQFTFTGPLAEGVNSITAKVVIVDPSDDPSVAGIAHVTGRGGESASLLVTLDTTPPPAPSIPDLLASSDSGGISDDDITTISTPKFAGTGEANALIHLFANGAMVAQGVMTPSGTYELTVVPLADGVYSITANLEDLAGNVGLASGPLKVTIANQVLNLPGATAPPASMPVTVDLGTGTIGGFPGIPGITGKIGILGIPVVNFDVNGQSLTILGTSGDDGIHYRPTGSMAGTVTRDRSTQVLNFASVGGTFTIDPIGGVDTVTVEGTPNPDTINVSANIDTTVQVNSLLPVHMPIGNVERLVINSGDGADTINITVFNSVNANLFVDAGPPSTNPPNGDTLNVIDGSGSAKIIHQPGGAVHGTGSIFISYPRTTGNKTRIDYAGVEKIIL